MIESQVNEKMPLAVKVDTLCGKSSAPKRLSAVSAAANINSASAKKTDLQQRKTQINQLSREELDEMLEESRKNYEACKSIKEDFDRSFNTEELSGAQKKRAKKNAKGGKANDKTEAQGNDDSTTTKTKQDTSVAKDQSILDDEVSQLMSQKSGLNSSISDLRTSNDTLDSSGLSTPVSLDFEMNGDQSMSQEKIEYYTEIKTINSITILANSTNKQKSPTDLQLIAYIVHKLASFYEEYKLFKSRAKDETSIVDDGGVDQQTPLLKLSVFDIAKLVSNPPSEEEASPGYRSSSFDSELRCKLTAVSDDGDDGNLGNFVDLQFPDTLPDALRSELVMSLIQPKEFSLNDDAETLAVETKNDEKMGDGKRGDAVDLFEELLLASSLEGIKFISVGKLSFENVMFYHYYFKDNKGLFIEAPVCCQVDEAPLAHDDVGSSSTGSGGGSELLKNVRIYTACLNHNFFYSVKYLFDAIAGKKNVIFKNSKLGFPSNFAATTSSQPQAAKAS